MPNDRVVELKLELFEWQSVPYRTIDHRGAVGPTERNGLLRLRTADGLEGHCFLGGNGLDPLLAFRQIDERLRDEVVGMDVSDRQALWERVPRLTGPSASVQPGWAPIDVALWDLEGKRQGMPLVDLLGRRRGRIPAYATYPPVHEHVADLIGDVETLLSEGFVAYKLHPGPLTIEDVRKAATALRDLGDDIALMLDPNARYSLDEAIEVGHILDQTRFRWFEDPLPMGEIEGNLTLAKAIDTPVAISDALTFTPRQMQFFAHRGFDTLRGSSRWLGVTGLREACRIMESNRGNCEIGLGGNPSMNAANLHVMLSVTNCDYYEHWLPAERHQFGVLNQVEPVTGWMTTGDGPGLGLELDEEWLTRHRVSN